MKKLILALLFVNTQFFAMQNPGVVQQPDSVNVQIASGEQTLQNWGMQSENRELKDNLARTQSKSNVMTCICTTAVIGTSFTAMGFLVAYLKCSSK